MKRKLFIATLLFSIVFVSCKKEQPQPTQKSGEEQENPTENDISVIDFDACIDIAFNKLDSIQLRKIGENQVELERLIIYPSDFITPPSVLKFKSSAINPDVLGSFAKPEVGEKIEFSVYLSVALNQIPTPPQFPSQTNHRWDPSSSPSFSPCASSNKLYKASTGNDSQRCKLVGTK